MTENEQIQEMARDAHHHYKTIEEMARILCGEREKCCDACEHECEFWSEASTLYNADYRKASEVAREIFAEIDKLIIRRMIADTPLIDDTLITDIAELKKKYTEATNNDEE